VISRTIGEPGGFSLLRFDDDGVSRFFKKKGGMVYPIQAASRVPSEFAGQTNWTAEDAVKQFVIPEDRSKQLFAEGVYVVYPSGR
jgi:hypothetical protein